MINIAVLGCGTVGSGVVDVFFKNKESLERKAGQELDLKYILDVRDFPDSLYADRFVKDFNVILNDDSISIVVEVIGGGTIDGATKKVVSGLATDAFNTYSLTIDGATVSTALRFTSEPASGEFSRWFIDDICVTK